ncbi:MAG TPA: glycosyl hydrolase family 79 C-terminal domain-containing protein, partial [Rhizomicrobium sp.]|nr:glycosyl hydrolase family 79 C-terminal domain-containing protein [Rhizomicrobium sp.]
QAAKGERLALALDAGDLNLTAYATRSGTNMTLTVINKDMSRDASVTVTGAPAKQARVMRLTAPSLTAATGITLGGAAVDASGKWSGGKSEPVKLSGAKAMFELPSGSAALVTFQAHG